MSAAFGNGQNVMNFLYRSQPTFPQTHLTERMLRRIAVTDAFPRSAVLAVDIGATLVFVVLTAFLCAVLFTKLSFTEVGTAGVRAWSEWSLWHLFTSLGMRKAPRDLTPMRLSVQSFMILLYNTVTEKASAILLITCHTEAKPDAEPHGSFCYMPKNARC